MDETSPTPPTSPADHVPRGASGRFERVFEVSIEGVVPPSVLARLGDVEVSSQEMRTVLTGYFRDQSEVYGFLERLRSYALEVVEVRRVGDTGPSDHQTDES
jgi:hypothetical protein